MSSADPNRDYTPEAHPLDLTVAGVFQTMQRAEDAAREIHASGLATGRISLVSRSTAPEVGVEDRKPEAGIAVGAGSGALLGGALALAAFAVPGIGPLVAAGPLVSALSGGRASRERGPRHPGHRRRRSGSRGADPVGARRAGAGALPSRRVRRSGNVRLRL
jgi:hypothetical protein